MVKEYVKKPVVIRAVQFTRDNFEEIQEFTHGIAKGFTIESIIPPSKPSVAISSSGIMKDSIALLSK